MSRTKRLTALLLMAFLASQTFACGDTGTPDETTDNSGTTTEAETTDPLLPKETADFGEKKFTVITTSALSYIYAEEQNGSAVNDAMYERDQKTEETLNVDIGYHIAGATIKDVFPAVSASVMAGDHDYDLIVSHVNWDLTSYVSDNIVLDWNAVPHVDFDKVYWNKNIINSLSINGKSPYAASDMFIGDTVFLLLNKKLAEDMKLGNLYTYVYDGKWTWDLLAKISADISGDIDGNGEMNELDRYGVVANVSSSSWMLRNIPGSCGQMIYTNGKNGLELTVNNEQTQSILEKSVALFHGGGGYILKDSDKSTAAAVANFNRGNYLTYFVSMLSSASAYNNLDFDYGVLPLPKYDEKQESYKALSWSHNMMIPSTADAEMSGMVSEWMSYYGHKLVRPKFYDSLLSVRFAQDEETIDMLDLIWANIDYDPGMNFKSQNFYGYFDDMVKAGTSDFASFYQSSLESEENYLKTLNESFENFGK